MADEYPDPDEEFELMHAEEMEMLNEIDDVDYDISSLSSKPKAKKSLDFKAADCKKIRGNSCSPEPLQNNSFISQNEEKDVESTVKEKQSNTNNILSEVNSSEDPVNTETIIQALHEVPTNTSKRRAEELFGDIDDIDFDEDHTSKKTKHDDLTEEQKQLLTIETIVLERKRLQEAKILPRLSKSNTRTSKSKKVVFSRFVPRWNFMPLTDSKGERIYAKLHTEEEFEEEISQLSNQNHSGGLLSVPFEQLEKLAHEHIQSKWNRIEKRQLEERSKSTDVEIIQESEGELWVEKYKPRSYLDLLSDESTNRALLQWLKLWDKVVFNREKKVKIKPKDDKGKNGKFQKKTGPVVSEEMDEYGRPFHKIALLCGPPGLGKTTLAHMIANQAGYNAVEVNASDDRSPESFRTQLHAATQMKAVMGAEPRPNCLVLDEIDGAPAASIDVLLKFALGKTSGRGKGAKAKKAPGGEAAGILKRPIICICNDVYVPALRPLRQAAFVVHFPPTAPARLAQRLCEVARMQSLKTDLGVMMALSEKTNNDIRSCLALLQCLKAQSGNAIRLSQVHATTIGQKDMQKGLFTVWQEIFQIPKPKRKAFVDTVTRETQQKRLDLDSCESKMNISTMTERVTSVLRTVQGCGDYERLAQGVFENYPNMKIKDSSMVSVANGMQWFCNFDFISSKIHTTQNYVLYPYLAYPFAVWHLIFSSLTWPKLTYPSAGYEMTVKKQRCVQIVDDVLKSMVPGIRAYAYREQLVLDILPLILEIIVPNLRPVSVALYNNKEKEELHHVINVMIDYNLTYTQERSPDGSFVFNVDPNVEEVSRLDAGKGGRVLGYAGRQLVAREVELERLRRAEASLYRGCQAEVSKPTITTEVTTPKGKAKKAVPNHLQKLTPKALKKVDDFKTKDFFGRVVETPLLPNQLKVRTDEIVKSDVWYHFKEGFNNAVRRNVIMADLY